MNIPNINIESYWEERLQDQWGLQGVGYLGLGESYNKWMYGIRKNIFFRNVKYLVNGWKNRNVLDIGSGTGFYIGLWKELNVRSITATDISSFAISNLKKSFPDVECFHLDISESLPVEFSDRRYDIISAFDVLFHIVEDKKYRTAIQNIYHLLRPQGMFILSENFIHGETIRRNHQVSRTQDEIEAILKDAGFKIVRHTPMFVIMNYPIDSKNHLYMYSWEKIMSLVERFPLLGLLLGGILFPVELVLTSNSKGGPSTEVMVCAKS